MAVSGEALTVSGKSDRSDQRTDANDLADLAESVEGIAQLLTILRKQLAGLCVPESESAAELSQGLDIAWIGSRRLLIELAAANKVAGNASNRERQSPRPKSRAQQRVV